MSQESESIPSKFLKNVASKAKQILRNKTPVPPEPSVHPKVKERVESYVMSEDRPTAPLPTPKELTTTPLSPEMLDQE